MTQGFCGFLLCLDGSGRCGEGAGCMAGAGSGFRCVLSCLQIRMKIKIFNSIKNKRVPSLFRKFL